LAEEDLLGYKVDDMAYTPHVALASVDEKRVTEQI
jgi:hypothetical protein